MFKKKFFSIGNSPRKKSLRVHRKTFILYFWILGFLVLLFLWSEKFQKSARFSKLKDFGEANFRALNEELKRLPIMDESLDSWRKTRVDGIMILSAFLDTRPEVVLEEDSGLIRGDSAWAMIRIIGIVPVKMSNYRLTCHYRYRYIDNVDVFYTLKSKSIGTRLAAFEENFGMYYCAAFILCELPGRYDDNIALPHSVTVTMDDTKDSNELSDDEFVIVRYPRNGWKNKISMKNEPIRNKIDNIAVCVQPLHHNFDATLDLVAFVEFYRMMGVDRFTFYRHSVDQRIDEILDYYALNGLATIIQWRLPQVYVYERNLRVDGIFAALNDCLYRSTFHASYRYVAGVDIDEYIVPRKHDNFQRMMIHLNPGDSTDLTGAWIFRNMFFYLMHENDAITLRPDLPILKVHAKTMRWQEINPPRDRSKFIVQGRDIIDLGNHHVWKLKRSWSIFGKRYEEVAVDPSIGGSHHYRKCETNVEICLRRPTTIDRSSHKFTDKLAERVANVTRTIFPAR